MSVPQFFARYNRPNKFSQAPNGVVVALRNNEGVVKFGWSACVEGDVFDKQVALDIAISRALKGNDRPVPTSISDVVALTSFLKDCCNYFKEELKVVAFRNGEDGKKQTVLFSNIGQEVPIGRNVTEHWSKLNPPKVKTLDSSLVYMIDEYAQRCVDDMDTDVLMQAAKETIEERLLNETKEEVIREIGESSYSELVDEYNVELEEA
jgi:hypothetical protein